MSIITNRIYKNMNFFSSVLSNARYHSNIESDSGDKVHLNVDTASSTAIPIPYTQADAIKSSNGHASTLHVRFY